MGLGRASAGRNVETSWVQHRTPALYRDNTVRHPSHSQTRLSRGSLDLPMATVTNSRRDEPCEIARVTGRRPHWWGERTWTGGLGTCAWGPPIERARDSWSEGEASARRPVDRSCE